MHQVPKISNMTTVGIRKTISMRAIHTLILPFIMFYTTITNSAVVWINKSKDFGARVSQALRLIIAHSKEHFTTVAKPSNAGEHNIGIFSLLLNAKGPYTRQLVATAIEKNPFIDLYEEVSLTLL